MSSPVAVSGADADRFLVSDGAEAGGGPVVSLAGRAPDGPGDATRLLVALGDADVAAVEGVTTIRWLDGTADGADRTADHVIAQAGSGLWRRAPWPVGDAIFSLAPPSAAAPFLVVGRAVARREALVGAMAGRSLPARAAERIDAGRLEAASAVVWLGERDEPVPAGLMAPLAAGRVLIVAGRRADFGLQAGVDHLAALDDDEALALASALAARPDAFAELVFLARLAAEAHRASGVFTRLLTDLDIEDRRAPDR